jgi:uncharacterized paraquat-inducible protein A
MSLLHGVAPGAQKPTDQALMRKDHRTDSRVPWPKIRSPPVSNAVCSSGSRWCRREAAQCVRCGGVLHRNRPDSLNRTLALTIAGILLFIVANSFPFLSLEMQGQETQTTLITGVVDLYQAGDWPIAAVVLFTSILAPGLQLALAAGRAGSADA